MQCSIFGRAPQGTRFTCPQHCQVLLTARSQPRRAHGFQVVARSLEAGVGMWGTKAGMTQIFLPDGTRLPCTVIAMEPGNIVTQVKTTETDGYNAVQVGYDVVKHKDFTQDSKKTTRRRNIMTLPEVGHCLKVEAPPLRHLREFRVKSVEGYEPGQQLKLEDTFKEGDKVDVAGTSIGKGFQGTIKRWNHSRGPMSHGSKSHRQHGSIGQSATPARVLPGLKMAGRMGNERKKIRKLQVVQVRTDVNALIVKGAVPGKVGNILEIAPAKIVGITRMSALVVGKGCS
ncbi:hypothetical protein WJX73_001119 [Symbiochloris irregularis]|uniref:Large ribosomal subunit protein uL3c n=1 Tax=Symbiochloris irregularis TaxID=706552 RepID=A0AAW1P7D3_9CHLO